MNASLEMFCVPFAETEDQRSAGLQKRGHVLFDGYIGLLRALDRIFHHEVFMRRIV